MGYTLPEKFLKPYEPSDCEARLYDVWEKSGYFNPDNLPDDRIKPWCTIMPPPNANGRLHVGHCLDITLKDILTRWRRMQGYKVLFLPGSDHAGFETQIVYEKKLEKEGRTRFQMTSDELYKEIMDFTLENKKVMQDDIRKMGTSCVWSRDTFTLDPDIVKDVHNTFRKMYKDELIYRGKRSINWCPKHQTSLSDVETEFIEQNDPFYYFQYGPFVIGTSRPETKFADKYIVVHPDDKRYSQYENGQVFEIEWINDPIKATIIKDEIIDKELGTGAMTITPWHSDVDFALAQKHNLPIEQIIDEHGKLLPIAEEFAGMKIEDARPKIVEKLKMKGLLVKIDEKYNHAVKVCYKCKRPIEPQIKQQWFVKMQPLAEIALKAVQDGKVKFLSESFEKTFTYWMNNTVDWNISRQIVWGISIPAWIKNKGTDKEEISLEIDKPSGDGWEKETDTFDTWFSSGQWPLLTLKYPDGKDFKTYYPTDVMETGRDLIFKWIPRMIMFGMYLANKEPFKIVYLHGMINDEHNQKISKSKGNVFSPIELAEEFGTDALRMSLIIGNVPGSDMALSKDKIRAYKKFANKLWNITRFVLGTIEVPLTPAPDDAGELPYSRGAKENMYTSHILAKPKNIIPNHEKYLEELSTLVETITKYLEDYKLYLAGEDLYHYIWHTFADDIIESCKADLESDDVNHRLSAQYTLYEILTTCLRLLHPFMPFITEEIWQSLPHHNKEHGTMLIVAPWPSHIQQL